MRTFRTAIALAVLASSAHITHAQVVVETVPVGNAGNAPDTRYSTPGYGAVGYAYNMGKYEVTAGQYTAFLNSVAASDTYGLYNDLMADTATAHGCNIQRSGSAGHYAYSVAAEWAMRPVNYITWGDAARFANWLHNGQPTGIQSLTTTEGGSYFLNGATSAADLMAVDRRTGASWLIPSADEWHKAAYHKNDGVTANYWDYPTATDSPPSNDLVNADPGNNANFYGGSGDYTLGAPFWRTEVGAFANSESAYGTFDQAGNVWEWTEKMLGANREPRGSGYDNGLAHFFMYAGSLGATGAAPTTELERFGFRMARVPEPATGVLLIAGMILGSGRRSRNSDRRACRVARRLAVSSVQHRAASATTTCHS